MLQLLLAAAITASAPVLVVPTEQAAFATQLRIQAIDADARYSGSRCDTAQTQILHEERVTIGDRADVAAAREKVRLAGCGRAHVENVAVARLGGDPPWKMVAGLPGEPLADMTLQQTAVAQVISQVGASGPPNCNSATLDDIYIAARPGHVRFLNVSATDSTARASFSVSLPEALLSQEASLDLAAAWVEVWPMERCGVGKLAAVVFVPNRAHRASAFFVVPLWDQVQAHGLGAKPAEDPPS